MNILDILWNRFFYDQSIKKYTTHKNETDCNLVAFHSKSTTSLIVCDCPLSLNRIWLVVSQLKCHSKETLWQIVNDLFLIERANAFYGHCRQNASKPLSLSVCDNSSINHICMNAVYGIPTC